MKTTIAAMDFGTSKIVTLVAENGGNARCDIVGAGVAEYDGFLPDGWNNPGDLNQKILDCIRDAEEQSHRKIHSLNIGVPAAFTKVYPTQARISLKGDTNPRVTPADVKAVFAAAEKNLGNTMGIVIHSSPAWFCVDNGKQTIEPVDLKGRELSALISFVVADRFFIEEVNNRITSLGYTVDGFYSTAAGESILFLPEEERDKTSVLIDVGYLNTDIMIVQGDALLYMDTIEIGGGDIAADLATSLDISMQEAEEKIKRVYVFGSESKDRTYDLPGSDGRKPQSFTQEEVSAVILPRVDELASKLKGKIEESGIRLGKWSNIYLTGGGLSFNRGGRDYLGARLARTVRDVPMRTANFNSYSFSSTLGLMDLIIDTIEQNHQQALTKGGAIRDFFRSLFGG